MKKHQPLLNIKSLIWIVILILGGLIVFGSKLPFDLPEPLNSWSQRFSPNGNAITDNIGSINLNNLGSNLQTLGAKSQIIQETVSQIASEAIKTDTGAKPLTEKALEYGRYLYCKQVVENWEKSTTVPTAPIPSEIKK